MVTLNTFAFDSDDAKAITGAFNQLKNKDTATLIEDDNVKKKLLARILSSLTLPKLINCQFQNLLEFAMPFGKFYIAQMLLDLGFPAGSRSTQTFDRVYHFQVIGFAELSVDFGKTIIRPELKADNILFGIFNRDIELNNANLFNQKYYLTSDKKEMAIKHLDKTLTARIGKYNNLIIHFNCKDLYVTFANPIENFQMKAIEEIFCNCNFLKADYNL